jgi:hypothetical protein
MNKKILSILMLTLLLSSILAVIPLGHTQTTEEEIAESIEKGLAWLAAQQNPDGSWGDWNIIATTGLAVLKFIDAAKEHDVEDWTDPDYVYHDVVVAGLDYIFSQGYYVDIAIQPAGDPDTLDNDQGIRFVGFDDYETSIALMALGATMTPDQIVAAPGPLTGLTYADVVQDVVDYLSYVQRESTYARGGWGYEGDPDWADNSVSGYASLGLGYAQSFGATVPQFVKDELQHWIGIIQSPTGYSYYRPPAVWPDPYGDLLLKTGNLLYEMALVGMPLDDPQVQLALTYIENNWALGGNSYQSAFCLMKGLEAYGITDEISVGVTGDWFNETATYIVDTQNPTGNWPNDPHDGDDPYILTAAWALLTLERAVAIPQIHVFVDVKPGSCPNPININSKGVVTVAICGTEEFDVRTIDPPTVMALIEGVDYENGAPPVRWSYEDVATPFEGEICDCHELEGDGIVDLVLKYKTQELVGLDLSEHIDETIPLMFRGNLKEEYSETAIEGQDCIRVQAPKKK